MENKSKIKHEIKQEPAKLDQKQLVTAHRVAEILKAAGETFCRLGECTMMLDQTANPTKTKVSVTASISKSAIHYLFCSILDHNRFSKGFNRRVQIFNAESKLESLTEL